MDSNEAWSNSPASKYRQLPALEAVYRSGRALARLSKLCKLRTRAVLKFLHNQPYRETGPGCRAHECCSAPCEGVILSLALSRRSRFCNGKAILYPLSGTIRLPTITPVAHARLCSGFDLAAWWNPSLRQSIRAPHPPPKRELEIG